jgi:hypothetical protein
VLGQAHKCGGVKNKHIPSIVEPALAKPIQKMHIYCCSLLGVIAIFLDDSGSPTSKKNPKT